MPGHARSKCCARVKAVRGALCVAGVLAGGVPMLGQTITLDPGLSVQLGDPVYTTSEQNGFNASYDSASANFTNPAIRLGTTDQLQSSVSNFYNGLTLGNSNSFDSVFSPLTDSASTIMLDQVYRTNRYAVTGFEPQSAMFQSRRSPAGTSLSLTQNTSMRGPIGAFRESASTSTAGLTTGLNVPQDPATASLGPIAPGGVMTPLFTQQDPTLVMPQLGAGASASLQSVAAPSSQVGAFYESSSAASAGSYAYDDGRTPLGSSPLQPGIVIRSDPSYATAAGGFSDSTRGQADSMKLPDRPTSPFDNSTPDAVDSTPFSSPGGFGTSNALQPNLNAPAPMPRQGGFLAYERKLQRERLLQGDLSTENRSTILEDHQQYELLRNQRQRRRKPKDTVKDRFGDINTTQTNTPQQ